MLVVQCHALQPDLFAQRRVSGAVIPACAQIHVSVVHAAGTDPHENLVFSWSGNRDILTVLQLVQAAIASQLDGAHRVGDRRG